MGLDNQPFGQELAISLGNDAGLSFFFFFFFFFLSMRVTRAMQMQTQMEGFTLMNHPQGNANASSVQRKELKYFLFS